MSQIAASLLKQQGVQIFSELHQTLAFAEPLYLSQINSLRSIHDTFAEFILDVYDRAPKIKYSQGLTTSKLIYLKAFISDWPDLINIKKALRLIITYAKSIKK